MCNGNGRERARACAGGVPGARAHAPGLPLALRPPPAPPGGPGCRGGRHLASPGAVPRGSRESLGEGRSPARGARRRVRAGVRSGRGAFPRALRRRCRGGAVHLETEEIPRQRASWCAPMVIVTGRVEEGVGRLLCAFPWAARSAGAIVCLLRGERGLGAAGSARPAPRPGLGCAGLGSELQSCSSGISSELACVLLFNCWGPGQVFEFEREPC